MEVPLTDLSILIGNSSFYVQRLASKSFDMASLVSPLTFSNWHNLEITARELPRISLHSSTIIFVLVLNPQSFLLRNKGIGLIIDIDIKILRG